MVSTPVRGSTSSKQLIWDLKALEPLRPGHASNKKDKRDDCLALRMKEPMLLQGVFAEVISSMDLTTLDLLTRKKRYFLLPVENRRCFVMVQSLLSTDQGRMISGAAFAAWHP